MVVPVPPHPSAFDLSREFFPSCNTHVHAALPRHEVVAAPAAARVDELFAHLGGCVEVIPSDGGRTLPFVQRIQAEDGDGLFRTAVLLAGGEVLEAVGVPLAAAVEEGLALHGGHVEEVLWEEGTARSLVFREPADLGNFWYSETCLLALLVSLEVVGISLAPSIVEDLTLLGDRIVVKSLDIRSAGSLVHLKQTHAFW